ncbi:MAG: DEAD/DEAH box helicase family protein [Ferruginibacter sp.]
MWMLILNLVQRNRKPAMLLQKVLKKKAFVYCTALPGSGKTQVYVKLMERYFKQDKQVLYLLPEIALTAQIIRPPAKTFWRQYCYLSF